MSEQETHPGKKRSDATRRALMRAAREEFAELGLSGARVDRIAEAAGVNKERIYGLFGSKDKLFDAVLIDALREFNEINDPLSAFGDARKFVGRVYDYHREHPQLLRLMVWESLHRGEDAHDIDGWRDNHYRKKIERAMADFGATSRFQAGMLTLALCGMPNWVNLAAPARRMLLGDEADDSDAIREFLCDFAETAATALPGRAPGAVPAKGASAADEEGVSAARGSASVDAVYPAQVGPGLAVRELTDPVDAAAERLRRAQTEADAARAELGAALREANAEGASANRLAKQVAGTVSRPVVLKLLAE